LPRTRPTFNPAYPQITNSKSNLISAALRPKLNFGAWKAQGAFRRPLGRRLDLAAPRVRAKACKALARRARPRKAGAGREAGGPN